MNKKFLKNNILNIVLLVLSIILSLIPFVIAPVCPAMPNGKYMNCHYTGKLVMFLGISIVLISIILLFVKNKKINILFYSLIAIISSAIHLIPHRIVKIQFGYNHMKNMPRFFGYCSKESMDCVVHKTFIFSSIFAFVILFICIICIIFNFIKKEEKNEKN